MGTALLFGLLGPVEAWVGGREVPLGGPRARAVLSALLLEANRVVSLDAIVAAAWGDDPPDTARFQTQNRVSALRRVLRESGGEDAIETAGAGYVIHVEPGQLDVLEFDGQLRDARTSMAVGQLTPAAQTLASALGLWRGPALHGLDTPRLRAAARRLDEARLTAQELLVDIQLRCGRHHEVIGELLDLVAAHPWREHAAGQLMLALYRAGRRRDALEAFEAAARRSRNELGLDPGNDLVILRDQILRDDPALAPATEHAATEHAAGTVAHEPDREVPRQLPASPADFVGRGKELHRIRALVTEATSSGQPPPAGSSTVISISGMAGVGKTTLAVRAAHDLLSHFPGGCLYADLHGAQAPSRALHTLGAFLRACGLPGSSLPSTVEQRAAMYRTLLAERKILVVLDNVAGEEQVRLLLPGAGSTVLLTSRRPLTGLHGAHLLRLDVLAVPDAVELLAAVAGKDRVAVDLDAAQRIAELCGGLPLAVRVAAVRLATNDTLGLTGLSARLADERERLDELALGDVDVRASLAISSRQLTPRLALLWQTLCVLPLETVPAWLVASTLDVSTGRAHRLLEELSAAHLLTAAAPDRYSMHDLIRLVGRELAAERAEDISALALRACRQLLARIRQADMALPCRPTLLPASGPVDRWLAGDPVEFLDTELDNIVAAVGFAVSAGEPHLAAELTTAVFNFCLMRSYTDQWEQCHHVIAEYSTTLSAGLLATVELQRGTLDRSADRNRQSLRHLRHACLLFRGLGDDHGEAVALLSWSIAVRMLGRFQAARQANERALELLYRVPDPNVHLGYALMAQHHFDGDLDPLHQALAIFDSLGEHWGSAEVHSLLADQLRARDSLDAATRHAYEAIDAYRRIGDRVGTTTAELMLARIHLARADHQKTLPLLHHALRAAQDARHRWNEAIAHRLLGQVMIEQRETGDALAHLSASASILREADLPLSLALTLEWAAKAHAELGQVSEAARTAHEALDILTKLRPQAADRLADWMAEAGLQ